MAKKLQKKKKKWSDLSGWERGLVIGASIVHLGVVGAVHADLSRRPAEQIRGPKIMWRLITPFNTSFCVAYFAWGRRRPIRPQELPAEG